MKLIRLAVERPVTTAMFYAAVVLVGLITLFLLPRELFPTITFPELLVVTRYGAAAPEEVENIITKLIEEQTGTVPNLKRVRSISREGLSVVILEFNWGTDMGLAHLAVREKIDLIKDRLPTESEEPIIQLYNPFAQPLMILSVAGDLPFSDLTKLSSDVIKKRLQKVDGVASATVSGGQAREVLVEVDLPKMQASNISLSGIVDSLKTSNVNYPAGSTQGRFYEYLVRTIGEFKSVSDIQNTVVAMDIPRESMEFYFRPQSRARGAEALQPRAQRLIPLGNIAEIKDTFKEAESFSRHNGKPNISIAIQKQYNANTIRVVRRVRRALEELKSSLPASMRVDVVYDESQFIKGSIQDVTMDAILGGVLAFLVLLYFLRRLDDALIVTVSLPISILVVFIYLYFADRTVNVIALAGLSLGIGSIIDNSIAVLDSIVEKRAGRDLREASVEGASEVAVPQVSSMLTNVVVFLPLLFAAGLAQQLFKDLFYAAVISNIAALVVALTLVPRITAYAKGHAAEAASDGKAGEAGPSAEGDDLMIGVGGITKKLNPEAPVPLPAGSDPNRELKAAAGENRSLRGGLWSWVFGGLTEERTEALLRAYRGVLESALRNRKAVLGFAALCFLLSLGIFFFKTKVFLPSVDQGQFLIRINMPVGTRLDVTNRITGKVERVLQKMEEVKDVLVRVGASAEESVDALGSHQSETIVTLDRRKTDLSTQEVILRLKNALKATDFEGGEAEYLLQDSSIKSVTGTAAPIAVTLKGPDIATLRKLSDEIQALLKSVRGVEGVKTSLALPSFETRVQIDKERASGFGLSVSEIARASLIGIRGFIATFYKEEGKEIPVRVRLREEDRNDPSAIQRITIRNQQGVMVPLGDVAKIRSGYGPSEIQRMDQQRAVVVSAQVIGRSVGEAVEEVDKKLTARPEMRDYTVELGGAKKEIQESFGGIVAAFAFAVLLIYMIMAAGFESLLHPFLIMITVPLGVIGVAVILFLTGVPISAPVGLGIVLLGGIVVNNGIVLIDQINFLRRKEQMDLRDAVLQGCSSRLRPVLMTALTTILSLLPVALGLGQGTEVSSPMAIATLGGLLVATGLTLVVLPILYVIVEERRSLPPTEEAA